jgi:gamma-glutamyl-gamma-aminobutyrate hydrolase PuuD
MKKLFNLYVVGGGSYCYRPFSHVSNLVESMAEANVIVFTGGADIDPMWYNCEKHPTTHPDLRRDIREVEEYKQSFNYPNIKMRIGVCRGCQLLAALSGAKLIQDVTHHCTTHEMIGYEGDVWQTKSIHHQMVYPWDMIEDEYDILYYSKPKRSNHYLGDKIDTNKVKNEPEVIWFPKTKSLGIQGHPEMMDTNHETVIMLNKLITKLIIN